MIVKVQISQYTTEPVRQVLVYNEDRSIEYTGPASRAIIRLLRHRPKAYFNAELKNGQLGIGTEVPSQDW